MTDPELRQLADAMADVIRPHLQRSESLRQTCALIGNWLTEQAASVKGAEAAHATHPDVTATTQSVLSVGPLHTDAAGPPVITAESASADEALETPIAAATIVPSPGASVPISSSLPITSAVVPLKLGDAQISMRLSGTTEELGRVRHSAQRPAPDNHANHQPAADDSEVGLDVMERRCRIKAESCRLFIRKRAADPGSEAYFALDEQCKEMIGRARQIADCFLWAFYPGKPKPDDAGLELIARNYDVHADALALVRQTDAASATGQPMAQATQHAFELLAEANSALRVALAPTWMTTDDRDQFAAHLWLKEQTRLRHIFVEGFMSFSHAANPAGVEALAARIAEASTRIGDCNRRSKEIKKAINKIKYHATRIADNGAADAVADWTTIDATAAKLEQLGVPSSDLRITEAVGARAAAAWADDSPISPRLSGIIERVRAQADRTDDASKASTPPPPKEYSASVVRLREALRGQRLVIIGGERNRGSIDLLTEAFEPKAAEWVELKEHGPGTAMRAPIQRPDTALVIVIVKLSGHLHVDEARAYR